MRRELEPSRAPIRAIRSAMTGTICAATATAQIRQRRARYRAPAIGRLRPAMMAMLIRRQSGALRRTPSASTTCKAMHGNGPKTAITTIMPARLRTARLGQPKIAIAVSSAAVSGPGIQGASPRPSPPGAPLPSGAAPTASGALAGLVFVNLRLCPCAVDQPVTFDDVHRLALRRAETVNLGISIGLDAHGVDDQRVAFPMSDRIAHP